MANQYLTFTLNGFLYALEVFKVQEVLIYTQPAKVPCAQNYVEGIISSRGEGISVVDLRKRFKLPEAEPTKDTRIIVIEIKRPTEEDPDHICTFGAIADSVQEVMELEETQVAPPPKFGNNISSEFISALGKNGDDFIIVLDAEKIFSASDVPKLN